MLKVYLNVIHALLTLTDMHRYHAQFSMVTSGMNMVSVVFIGDKLLKLCASVYIHITGISSPLNRNTDCPQSLLHQLPGYKTTSIFLDSHFVPDQLYISPFHFCDYESISLDLASFLHSVSQSGACRIFNSHVQLTCQHIKLEEMLSSLQTSQL